MADINTDIAPVALQPVASPVDTYERPTQDNSLMDFARGLSALDGGLKDYVEANQATAAVNDALVARSTFETSNRVGYDAAVSQGLIPANASPHFVAAYKQASGGADGGDMLQYGKAGYDNWSGKTTDDPAAFGAFVSGLVKANIKSNDPAYLKGIEPYVQQLTQTLTEQHMADVHSAVVAGMTTAVTSQVSQVIDGYHNQGLASPTGTDYTALGQQVIARYQDGVGAGMTADGKSKTIVSLINTLGSKALELRDPNLLKLMDMKVPGQDYTFAETPEGVDLKREYTDKMETLAREAVRQDREAQVRADTIALNKGKDTILQSLMKDPSTPIDPGLLNSLVPKDGTIRWQAQEWQKGIQEEGAKSDPKALLAINEDIIKGGGMDTVMKGLSTGIFANPADLKSSYELAKSVDNVGPEKLNRLLEAPQVKDYLNLIQKRTASINDPTDAFGLPGISEKGLALHDQMRRGLVEWAAENPNATMLQQLDAIKKIGDPIIQGLPDPNAGAALVPGGPQDPYAPKPAGGGGNEALPSAVRPAPAPSTPVAPKPTQGSLDPGFKPASFTDVGHASDLQTGSDLGKTLGNLVDEATSEGHVALTTKAIQDAVDNFTSNPKAPLKGTYALSTIKDDPTAAHILDFVSQYESGGNYNAYFGHAHSRQDLSGQSLDGIIAMQKARTEAGAPSSAIGRYQFIRSTLVGLKKQLGLTGQEPFTPELQDRLGLELLKARGLGDFKSGKMTSTQFADSLAKEWASLPNTATGKSHYVRSGLNEAGVDSTTVLKTLDSARTQST